MNPAILQILITTSADIAAQLIRFLREKELNDEAMQIELVLKRADSNWQQLIDNA